MFQLEKVLNPHHDFFFGNESLRRCERVCSLVVARASITPEVLGSTPQEANILEFNGVMHLVVGDVFVDSETSMVTSSVSRIFLLSLRRCS
jgi:hypothetical protein